MAAILKITMAAKIWTCQLASIKIPVEQYLNYLCAKIHNFIQKCTPNYLRTPTITSCSSLMHSYLFPFLDVLYRQVGNLSFWRVRCTEFLHGGHQGALNTMTSASLSIYLSDLSCQRKQASFALRQVSSAV